MSSNRISQTARVSALIAGATKYFSNTTSVTFGGTSYTAAALAQELQNILAVYTDVDAARAALKAKLLVEKNQAGTDNAFLSAFRAFVMVHFGKDPVALAVFGIAPPKARTLQTVEAKALTVDKALATRAARHTMGKRQKAKITGVVPQSATSGTQAPPVVEPPTPPPGGATAPKQ
jgi:hypothetical protein